MFVRAWLLVDAPPPLWRCGSQRIGKTRGRTG